MPTAAHRWDTGERSEKIRTYNYPQNRVTDHRINVSIFNLPAVMEGSIDQFIEELSSRDEADRLSASGVEDDDQVRLGDRPLGKPSTGYFPFGE